MWIEFGEDQWFQRLLSFLPQKQKLSRFNCKVYLLCKLHLHLLLWDILPMTVNECTWMFWQGNNQDFLLHEFASVQLPFFLYKVGSINSLFLGVFMFLDTNYNAFTVSVLSFISEGIRSRILGVSRFFSPWNVKKWGSTSFLFGDLHWPWLQLCKSHIANSITWCFKQLQKIDTNVQYSRLMMAILQFVLINRCSFLNSASQLRMGSYRINLQSYLAEASGYYVLQKLTF